MDEGRLERSSLDEPTLVRISALAAVDGPPASWLDLLDDADRVGLLPAHVEGALVAISPLIGTARASEDRGAALSGLGRAAMASRGARGSGVSRLHQIRKLAAFPRSPIHRLSTS